MSSFAPSQPESEEIELSLVEDDVVIQNFTEYSFNSNFLTPTDGWHFTIGAETLDEKMRKALQPGAKVQLKINGFVQSTGYIDSITIGASRGSGTTYQIAGRDVLGQVVDTCADPTVTFKQGQTLQDVLVTLLTPFGWSAPDDFIIHNDANRDAKTGGIRGPRGRPPPPGKKRKTRTTRSKKLRKRELNSYQMHLLRPYTREGLYEFIARISQRFGLWVWATADGAQVVISKPDFETPPLYILNRNAKGETNILDGSVKWDLTNQPSVIIADGYAASGQFGKSPIRAIVTNDVTGSFKGSDTDLKEAAVYRKYRDSGANFVETNPAFFPFDTLLVAPFPRVLYLHDDESKTQEQLDNFVKRELALLQRQSLTVNYTVEGHGQGTGEDFVPWIVDTMVDVHDEIAGVNEPMYVMARTFNKSRSGGTTTNLELIRKNTLVF